MKLSPISFRGEPQNYAKVDQHLSRSAQPQKMDLLWLKEQGVTDIFNFRTMVAPEINFDEKEEVEKLGMKYHNIPSITNEPSEENVKKFLSKMEEIIANKGKAHIHCKAGADRTGLYALIYKSMKKIGNWQENWLEMIKRGHFFIKYQNVIPFAEKFVNKNILFIK